MRSGHLTKPFGWWYEWFLTHYISFMLQSLWLAITKLVAISFGISNPKHVRVLVLVVLKSHIAIFSTTNTKKHAAMVKGKQKNLDVDLQCTAKDGCAL